MSKYETLIKGHNLASISLEYAIDYQKRTTMNRKVIIDGLGFAVEIVELGLGEAGELVIEVRRA